MITPDGEDWYKLVLPDGTVYHDKDKNVLVNIRKDYLENHSVIDGHE